MKRTEMIKILIKNFPSWNDQVELTEYDFHGILKILESHGMLPPKEFEYPKAYNGSPGSQFISKWDSEK